jgi:transposase-like protein
MLLMPKAFPKEFKEDVLRVARNRGPDTSLEQIAKDFGISSSCLQRWIKQEAVDEGREVGVSTDQAAENRERSLTRQCLRMPLAGRSTMAATLGLLTRCVLTVPGFASVSSTCSPEECPEKRLADWASTWVT